MPTFLSSEIVCFAESAALPPSYRSGGLIVNSIVDNLIDDVYPSTSRKAYAGRPHPADRFFVIRFIAP
jgi:hypothetical protein